ncbi:hypothetical protein [Reichenbachiella sp. MALMAid0571]|uniref:hypothetical protein n=1 Tax=Reichenbachiella sp. MALMAid0571 TaxID=3143939 RepID=UPI0032DEB25F
MKNLILVIFFGLIGGVILMIGALKLFGSMHGATISEPLANEHVQELLFDNVEDRNFSNISILNLQNNQEIEDLVRKMLNWVNSENTLDLMPVIKDQKDSLYIGIDLNKHQQNIKKLENSNYFGSEFIHTYDQIILAIDKKLKENSFESGSWHVGYYPPFTMSGGGNPWCNCQDVPYNSPVPWNLVEVEHISNNNYIWKWGGIENYSSYWNEFRYNFKVKKIGSTWKIVSLEGFDLAKIK